MDIFEMLKRAGVEIPEDKKESFNTEFRKAYKSEAEVTKKLSAVEAERDNWKTKTEAAEDILKGFEGKDFEAIQKERDDWKEKAEKVDEEYKKQLHERDYADMVKAHVESLTFTSESAKKAYIADLTAADLTMKDGKIFGLSDFHKSYAETDPSAFITEEQQQAEGNKATFTSPMGIQPKPGTKYSPEQLMKMKNENPGLDISQYI